MDDGLLQARQLRVSHLNAEVAARDHYDVGGVDDAQQISDRFMTLDLRHDPGLTAGFADELARLLDIGGITRERHGDVINFLLRAELDVLAIPVGERGRGNSAALAIEAFAIGELAPTRTWVSISCTADAIHVEHNLSVVQQEDIARQRRPSGRSL